jgi:hypothetical protein
MGNRSRGTGGRPRPSASDAASRIEAELGRLLDAGPDALLGAAAIGCTDGVGGAQRLLRSEFMMSPDRARSAVVRGQTLPRLPSTRPLETIAGVRVADPTLLRLRDWLAGSAAAESPEISIGALRHHARSGSLRAFARAAARSGDQPSVLVAVALLVSLRDVEGVDFVSDLRDALVLGQRSQSRAVARTVDRIVGAAYALDASSRAALDLGREEWTGATPTWRLRAAPWLLPVTPPGNPGAVRSLLDAMVERRLRFVSLGEDPFTTSAITSDVTFARDTAASVVHSLKRWADRPLFFDGERGGVQILLTEDDEYAYAWVGRARRGLLVSFDTSQFEYWTLDEPGALLAVAAALGWYIDTAVSLRKTRSGTPTMSRAPVTTSKRSFVYRPTVTYKEQRQSVRAGLSKPPRPHMVAAFLRRLPRGQKPNAEHVVQAPARLKREMGQRDTWVHAHSRGGNVSKSAWKVRLSTHSVLADILGSIEDRELRGPPTRC